LVYGVEPPNKGADDVAGFYEKRVLPPNKELYGVD